MFYINGDTNHDVRKKHKLILKIVMKVSIYITYTFKGPVWNIYRDHLASKRIENTYVCRYVKSLK